MALNKLLCSASFRGYSQSNEHNESNAARRLSLRGCLDRQDGVSWRADDRAAKARAERLHSQFVRNPNSVVGEELVNGSGSLRHGRPLGFPDRSMPEKMVVAVDVDEVLGSFLAALNKFIADRYSLHRSVSEYFVYEFFRQIWNCSRTEADIRVHEFFKTPYFTTGIHPIPGALHALRELSTFCSLSVVTSRQNVIKDHTLEWIEKHYPGLFQEIHFGNHFALDGQSRPKSEICRSLGAQVLIDDNPRYALECAGVGIRVLLFDYDNSYPWCKDEFAVSHPLVTKVHNWEEAKHHLLSWAVIGESR
ncbi:uncharacterized protein M6B38_370185 [Iris pallida]|uniref:Tac7077 n=1 Tax=Iris pallida TaxID=29817 RepID=A0AAX6GFE8_IRIPA|nr:uncharacterized protein M6B38_370185 [Iris pallida]